MPVGGNNAMHIGFQSWQFQMKTGCMHAEASQMTHMNCDVLNHSTPFPIAPPPAIAVAPTIAVPNPMIVVDDPPGAGKMGDNNYLDLH